MVVAQVVTSMAGEEPQARPSALHFSHGCILDRRTWRQTQPQLEFQSTFSYVHLLMRQPAAKAIDLKVRDLGPFRISRVWLTESKLRKACWSAATGPSLRPGIMWQNICMFFTTLQCGI